MEFASVHKIFFLIFFLLIVSSCGGFNPFNNKVSATSDGSYVVQTNATDSQLLQSGYSVVYRFQSIPNLVAVKNIELGNQSHDAKLSPDMKVLLSSNTRNRSSVSVQGGPALMPESGCYRSYCEAGFDQAMDLISQNQISLQKIQIGIVDSGVVPSTPAIANVLNLRMNVSGNSNEKTWPSHATMIASLFAGFMQVHDNMSTDTYAPNAKLNSVKITFIGDPEQDTKEYGSMQLAVALDKAVSCGSRIINLSLSYDARPDDNIVMAEELIMSAAAKKGVIFVVAAGNDNANLDVTPVYPASYKMDNLIVVGSHNEFLQKAWSSNYGNTVDLSAQGAFVYVNDKKGNIVASGGTSFSAPLVVSALALYFGVDPSIDSRTAMQDLFSTADALSGLIYNAPMIRYGKLNAKALLQRAVHRSETRKF